MRKLILLAIFATLLVSQASAKVKHTDQVLNFDPITAILESESLNGLKESVGRSGFFGSLIQAFYGFLNQLDAPTLQFQQCEYELRNFLPTFKDVIKKFVATVHETSPVVRELYGVIVDNVIPDAKTLIANATGVVPYVTQIVNDTKVFLNDYAACNSSRTPALCRTNVLTGYGKTLLGDLVALFNANATQQVIELVPPLIVDLSDSIGYIIEIVNDLGQFADPIEEVIQFFGQTYALCGEAIGQYLDFFNALGDQFSQKWPTIALYNIGKNKTNTVQQISNMTIAAKNSNLYAVGENIGGLICVMLT